MGNNNDAAARGTFDVSARTVLRVAILTIAWKVERAGTTSTFRQRAIAFGERGSNQIQIARASYYAVLEGRK